MSGPIKVALVGHCGADARSLTRLVQRVAPDAEIVDVHQRADLERRLPELRAALVNRKLEGRFDAADGVDLIAQLSSETRSSDCAPLLISDYEDAQRRAEEAGAWPGFGKSTLRRREAEQRLRRALGLESSKSGEREEKPDGSEPAGSGRGWLSRLMGRPD